MNRKRSDNDNYVVKDRNINDNNVVRNRDDINDIIRNRNIYYNSNHGWCEENKDIQNECVFSYNNEHRNRYEYDGIFLLNLAIDIADRLMPAFQTMTEEPVHNINLMYGLDGFSYVANYDSTDDSDDKWNDKNDANNIDKNSRNSNNNDNKNNRNSNNNNNNNDNNNDNNNNNSDNNEKF